MPLNILALITVKTEEIYWLHGWPLYSSVGTDRNAFDNRECSNEKIRGKSIKGQTIFN